MKTIKSNNNLIFTPLQKIASMENVKSVETISNKPLKKVKSFKSEFNTRFHINQTKETKKMNKNTISSADFMFGCTLGSGSYAKVVHAKHKTSKKEFAIKIMDQQFIKKENKVHFVLTEKNIMAKISHPFIVKFISSFRDTENLYILMEFCRGGNLELLIRKNIKRYHENGNFFTNDYNLEIIRFYIAEIILVLEYLYSKGIIHRDLKPENILLTSEGHIKLSDFGSAKDCSSLDSNQDTFCGTAEYVSPEVLNDKKATNASDLWALGCILHQMLTGKVPFHGDNDYLTFQEILNHKKGNLNELNEIDKDAIDLCEQLLNPTPEYRLGAGNDPTTNYEGLKNHLFFKSIDFLNLIRQKPPYIPFVKVIPEPNMDGENCDWNIKNYLIGFECNEKLNKHMLRKQHKLENGSLNSYLNNKENIILESTVKCYGWIFHIIKYLHIFLTSENRFIITNKKITKVKHVFYIKNDTIFKTINENSFHIITPNEKFKFFETSKIAIIWEAAIAKIKTSSND